MKYNILSRQVRHSIVPVDNMAQCKAYHSNMVEKSMN